MKRLILILFCVFGFANEGFAQINLNEGLLAYYPFDGDTDDKSGNELHGVGWNIEATTDRFHRSNSAYRFDGQASYIDIPDFGGELNFNALQESYSISVWVKFAETPIGSEVIFIDRASENNEPSSIFLTFHSGAQRFYAGAWDASDGVNHTTHVGTTSDTRPVAGEWYHLVMIVKAGVNITLYVNGDQEDSRALEGITPKFPAGYLSTENNETSRTIGKSMPGNSGHVGGKIDDIRIYNRELNEEEVQALYNQAVIVVNSSGDLPDDPNDQTKNRCWTGQKVDRDGEQENECTLRAAIETANAWDPYANIPIIFNIPGAGRPALLPTSPLPEIWRPVTIDGTTQPGSDYVEIDGSALTGTVYGLRIRSGSAMIKGLMIHSFPAYVIYIEGGDEHQIVGNIIGFSDEGETLADNRAPAIFSNESRGTEIGSLEDENINYIGGSITMFEAHVRVLKNVMEVPEDSRTVLISRLGGQTGPDCRTPVPPPLILTLGDKSVTGMTQPNAHVILYKVETPHTGFRRYYAHRAEPIADGPANSEGFFDVTIPEALSPGTAVAATAMLTDGRTSELSQVKRPIVFLPDAGGTWLRDSNGTDLWPPVEGIFESDEAVMERLVLLTMDEISRAIYPYRVVEGQTYGAFLNHLENNGYPGDVDNNRPTEQDLWRFPYDWRKSPTDISELLKVFIETITPRIFSGDDTWSCEVDLVAHGLGGLVAGAYLRKGPADSRPRVHRMITIGTPYLGAPAYAQLHIQGYLFGMERSSRWLRSFIPHWGRVTTLFRDFLAAYALLPSKKYFEAGNNTAYLQNFNALNLTGWDATKAFLGAPKPDPDETGDVQLILGLQRNMILLDGEQQEVHDLADDWRGWTGPPLILRYTGLLPNSTPLLWRLINRLNEDDVQGSTRREAENEPASLVRYRENLAPDLGWGDGVVPVESALSRGAANDFLGSSRWQDPATFKVFKCTHWDLVRNTGCISIQNARLMDQVLYDLQSGYSVRQRPGNQASGKVAGSHTAVQDATHEIFYVMGSAPLWVVLEDDQGRRTGPVAPDTLDNVAYEIPDVGYWASTATVTFSAPADGAYTLVVEAPTTETTVRVVRLHADETTGQTILFADQILAQNGQLRLNLLDGGTPENAAFEIDADGDGTYEGTLAPTAQLTGSSPGLALPMPTPYILEAELDKASLTSTTVSFTLSGADGPAWQWQLGETTAWITPDAAAGPTPATVTLTLSSDALAVGRYTDTLSVTLQIESYAVTYPVIVQLDVVEQSTVAREGEAIPGAFALGANYPNPFRGMTTIPFTLPTRSTVRLEILDVLGQRVGTVVEGTYPAGEHHIDVDGSGLAGGVYAYRLQAGEVQAVRMFTVLK